MGISSGRHASRTHMAVGLAAAFLALAAAGCDSGPDDEGVTAPTQHFASRPDLAPPTVKMTTAAPGEDDRYVFLAPKRDVAQAGPMILDRDGKLVWFQPLDTMGITDFRVQAYGGRPVLTWWRGRAVNGVGDGYYVIVDDTYRQIATVRAGRGLAGDVHEFLITPRDTALITVYERKPRDLSPVRGPRDGSIYDGVVQEIDIATGRVLFEWRSADHVELSESYVDPPPAERGAAADPYDYFHINSVDEEPDGNLLVSARNTHAVYEIRRKDGQVLWRLGGKKSDFRMGAGTTFAWQHDARRQPDGSLTLFDNGADPKVEDHSRVLRLRVDPTAHTATLLTSYAHPSSLSSGSQGNAQFLDDGNVFVGWGAQPYFTEFNRSGAVLRDGHFGEGAEADSYRAYLLPWIGHPGGRPAIAVKTRDSGLLTVYASWNGATLVRRWQVLAGPDPNQLDVITTVARDGFETAVDVETEEPFVAVRALDADGAILGTSPTSATGGQ